MSNGVVALRDMLDMWKFPVLKSVNFTLEVITQQKRTFSIVCRCTF